MNLFVLPNGHRVKVGGDALATINRYRQHGPSDHEASGLMIGRMLHSGSIVIDEITEPGPTDKRSRFACSLEDPCHQRRLDEAYNASGGCSVFLGHWHTHPEADPTPSSVDLADWRRRLSVDVYGNDFLLFIIAGTEKLGMWLGFRNGEIKKLESVS